MLVLVRGCYDATNVFQDCGTTLPYSKLSVVDLIRHIWELRFSIGLLNWHSASDRNEVPLSLQHSNEV
jgi:hypothetical protein